MTRIRLIEHCEGERIVAAMKEVGVDPRGVDIMSRKSAFISIRIFDLGTKYANILKQEMLALGSDAAVHKGCVDATVPSSDVVLFGTRRQMELLCEKLQHQSYETLKDISRKVKELVFHNEDKSHTWICKERILHTNQRTLIMGILNVTPDSFSDGGNYIANDDALRHVEKMIASGADIIDVGGESTRPGTELVDEEEELRRVVPVIEAIEERFETLVSIDTCKSRVAREALESGAHIVNDVSSFRMDEHMPHVVRESGAGCVLMHMQGTPANMQDNPHYANVVEEVCDFLEERIAFAEKNGIEGTHIVIDPGIGFGKTLEHNLSLLSHLDYLVANTARPLLIGVSRKRFIGEILELSVEKRLEGTLGAVCASILKGATIVRVHDVEQTMRAVRLLDSIRSADI